MTLKACLALFLCAIFSPAALSDQPISTGSDSSIHARQPELTLETGISWKSSDFEELYYYSLAYKQPSSFLGMPTRLSVELGAFSGSECRAQGCPAGRSDQERISLSQFDTPLVGVSQEVALLSYEYFYVSFALGGYLKKPSSRVGSVFTFGERLAIGTELSNYQFTLFFRHFSNASITARNGGHNFMGLSLSGQF